MNRYIIWKTLESQYALLVLCHDLFSLQTPLTSGLLPQNFENIGFFSFWEIREHRKKEGRGGRGRKKATKVNTENVKNAIECKRHKARSTARLVPFLVLARQAPYISFNGLISVI